MFLCLYGRFALTYRIAQALNPKYSVLVGKRHMHSTRPAHLAGRASC